MQPGNKANRKLHTELQRAMQLMKSGKTTEAILIYEEVSPQAGDDAVLNIHLGHFCIEAGDEMAAIKHYQAAVDQDPDNPGYLGDLGVAYLRAQEFDRAQELLERVVDMDPSLTTVVGALGSLHLMRGDYKDARRFLEQAHEQKPSDPAHLANFATTLVQLGEHDLAIKHATRAMQLDKSNPATFYVVGQVLAESGRTEEAVKHMEKTVRQHPLFGDAYDLLARMKKFSPEDKPFIDKTEKLLHRGMPARHRHSLHYALGKMYDDCKEYGKSFEHYRQANLLKNKGYDVAKDRRLFKHVRKAFNRSSIEKYSKLGNPSAKPVFIVGMPRSGTTLMERLIASHPQGAAAGELPKMPDIGRRVSPRDNLRGVVSKTHANLTRENIAKYTEEYLDVLCEGRADADRIVDKMPGNYFHVGLISILFPNATIINARRNPLDVCISCYFQNFGEIRWADDLATLADVYRLYRENMEYWKSVLPEGKVVDVHYEKIVENPESEARKLVEAAGLPWDDDSLKFYEQAGVVKTASLWQVRQPIYQSSKRRWEKYTDHIGELANLLSDYLDDDRERLAEQGIELAGGRGWLKRLIS